MTNFVEENESVHVSMFSECRRQLFKLFTWSMCALCGIVRMHFASHELHDVGFQFSAAQTHFVPTACAFDDASWQLVVDVSEQLFRGNIFQNIFSVAAQRKTRMASPLSAYGWCAATDFSNDYLLFIHIHI